MDRWAGRLPKMEYPDYAAEIEQIRLTGITTDLLDRIIERHQGCQRHMMDLYGRYRTESDKVPIFTREPRFSGDDDHEAEVAINNRVNNDFLGEIVDGKVGYFAGKPANYNYGIDYQAEEETGGEEAVEKASKALSDFVKRNNMFDVSMEVTKFAAICGYSGRLFYIDPEGNERAMVIPPYECIILSDTEMTEPEYAVRYYPFLNLNDEMIFKEEFYDKNKIYFFEGQPGAFVCVDEKPHLFDYCPLQGVPNNRELIGDAEKVLALIDDYDSNYSDNSNDIEGFANAYMVFKNCRVDNNILKTANATGVIGIDVDDPDSPYDVTYLTKNINGDFVNSHLDRAQDNIYRLSRNPNLNDPEFAASSGLALRIKMIGLETKTGTFEAKMLSADTYMFKVLSSSFRKKGTAFDPLQCSVKYNRNFPVDFQGEAQAVQALIAAGLPKKIAFGALSFIDDVDAVMRLIESEQDDIPDLDDDNDDDDQSKKLDDQNKDPVEGKESDG